MTGPLGSLHELPSGAVVILGGDPGDTTGYLLGAWGRDSGKVIAAQAYSCDIGAAPHLLSMLLQAFPGLVDALALEAFDTRQRGARLAGTNPTAIREVIETLRGIAVRNGITHVAARPPGHVKPWAQAGTRFEASGLSKITSKMADAKDAGKHALFCAVHDFGIPDPLSKRTS